MDTKTQLERRIVSANDRLREAQRNQHVTEAILWLKVRNDLLEQWPSALGTD